MNAPDHSAPADDTARAAGEKSPDAFRTISEVSTALDVPQHVLRFWEGKFTQIRPLKRGGGRRYYRPDDVDLLRGIQALLYSDGYTIKGVQKLLRENGVKFVIAAGRRRAEQPSAKIAQPPTVPVPEPVADSAPDLSPEAAPEFADWPFDAHTEDSGIAATRAPAAPPTAGSSREAAARLLGHLKTLRRDYDLKLRAAKNGRARRA